VSLAPGGVADIVARAFAAKLGESGRTVVVENRTGGGGTIGADAAAKSPPDGYTLYMGFHATQSILPHLMSKLPYDAAKDFLPVVFIATSPNILVVHPSVPAKTLSEFVDLLKKQPDKLTFSSGGFGTPAHLAGEMFKVQTNVRTTHVHDVALPRAIADLLNGTNQFQFITPLPVLALIASGKLRAIAVTGPARLPVLPDVPTVGEAGFPDLIIQDWFGILAKTGTPPEIVARLNGALNSALAKPRIREAIAKMAAEPAGGTPEEFGTFLRAQIGHWGKVVKDANIKMHQ
jgi:tripartite-type tricarboxylate transporter receptor subunit TctC